MCVARCLDLFYVLDKRLICQQTSCDLTAHNLHGVGLREKLIVVRQHRNDGTSKKIGVCSPGRVY